MHSSWYNTAAESGDLGLFRLNLETGVNEVNENWANLLGYQKSEVFETLDFLLGITHPHDRDRLRDSLEAIKQGKATTFVEEVRLRRKDGTYLWILKRGRIVDSDDPSERIVSGIHLDISEQKSNQHQFNKAVTRLEHAQHLANFGFWYFSPNKGIPIWSEMVYRIFDRDTDLDPLELDDMTGLIQGKLAQRSFSKAFQQTLKGGESYDLEFEILSEAGVVKHVRSVGYAIKSLDGEIIRLEGFIQDISESKVSEVELSALNSKLSMAIEATGSGLWHWDIKEKQIHWDFQVYRLFDADASMPISTIRKERIHPDDITRVDKELKDATEKGMPFGSIFRVVTRNSSIRYLESHGMVTLDASQRPSVLIGLVRDVTEEVNAREQVNAALHERNEILESIDDGFFTVNNQWVIIYWNLTTENLLAVKRHQVLGYDVRSALGQSHTPKTFIDEIEFVMEHQVKRTSEIYFSKNSKWIQVTLFPKNGGISVFLKDISDIKQMNETILEKVIKTREDEQDRIAKNLHDGVVQELTALTMKLNVFIQKNPSEEQKILAKIIKHLKDITLQVREISHHMISGDIKDMDLPDLCARLEGHLNAQQHIDFTFRVDVLDTKISDYIRMHVYRVLQELSNNIIKHSQAKHSTIILDEIGDELHLNVTDDGIGIGKDTEMIGIGLRNVQDRIHALGGSIAIGSPHSGKGAMVSCVIPLKKELNHID